MELGTPPEWFNRPEDVYGHSKRQRLDTTYEARMTSIYDASIALSVTNYGPDSDNFLWTNGMTHQFYPTATELPSTLGGIQARAEDALPFTAGPLTYDLEGFQFDFEQLVLSHEWNSGSPFLDVQSEEHQVDLQEGDLVNHNKSIPGESLYCYGMVSSHSTPPQA